jgi:hypothetical protein
MKLGGTGVRRCLIHVPLSALGVGLLGRAALCLLLVSARMLLALSRPALAPASAVIQSLCVMGRIGLFHALSRPLLPR